MRKIDLRSDTITRPTPAMLDAMMHAEVGDDVFSEDPTVNLLQERMAKLFGKEDALFVSSGTMGNELCVKVHTQPGDEIICEQEAHIFVYENAAAAALSGVQCRTLPGNNGMLSVEQIRQAIRPDAYYLPKTTLICLENTHGRSAGSILPLEGMKQIYDLAVEHHLKVHMDGARIWNATVASGVPLKDYAQYVDSLSVCFSKGLGAPVGSMILGTKSFIERARIYRKMWGGGMRQVGYLAAAALYAIDHNIDRLREDHDKAKNLAAMVREINGMAVDPTQVQTNMVFIDISGTGKTQSEILQMLALRGVYLVPERHNAVRAVMHLDVTMEEVTEAGKIFQDLFR